MTLPRLLPLALALLSCAAAAQDAKPKAWNVNQAPGQARHVSIDVRSGTWMSVDVSPDGKQVLFDLLGDLYVLPIEGGQAQALTHSVAWEMQARFSPDGQKIAFISDAGGGDNVWVMNRDGSGAKALSTEDYRLLNNPSWHPSGQYIAARKHFTGTRSAGSGEIWLYHLDGGKGVQLNEKPNWQKDLGEPALSPDGRYLYYSMDATPGRVFEYNKDSNKEIFRIVRQDLQDGTSEPLVSGPGGAIRPTPSPDGRYLAFVRRLRSEQDQGQSMLFLKDLHSGREWPVWGPLERDLQESWSYYGVYPAFAWMPDSKELVLWARGKLWRVDPFKSAAREIPFQVKDTREIRESIRFAQEVAPPEFDVRQLRWVQTAPDGKRVVYSALGHLYLKELPNGQPRRLTQQNEHFELFPSFSRDGQSVVYTTWNDEKLGQVRVRHLASGRETVVTQEPGKYLHPRLSPDGRSVVYQKAKGGYLTTPWQGLGQGLFMSRVDGSELQQLSKTGHSPQWGADSKAVFFTRSGSISEVDSEHKLVRLDLATREETPIAKGEFASEFTVSPDGRWLGFIERFHTYITPLPQTGKLLTVGSKMDALPVKRLDVNAGESLHWSGDSATLHYALGDELFSVPRAAAYAEGFQRSEQGLKIGFRQAADAPTGRIAFRGARIVTMRGDEVIEHGVLVTEGKRILAVGKADEVSIPAGTQVIEAQGKTLIPGLIDTHWHGAMAESQFIPQQSWVNYATLAFGVTTLHDPSNRTSDILTVSEMQRAGQLVGPRIFSTGTILYGAKADVTAVINNYDDALTHLKRLKAAGAFSVKSYNQPRREQRQQILEAARQTNMMVVPEGASLFQLNMNQVVDGHTTVEHALPLAEVYEDVKQLWSQTAVGYNPTLNVAYGGLDGEHYWYAHTEVWRHPILSRFVPRSVLEPRSVRRLTAPEQDFNVLRVARTATELQRAGVRTSIGAHGQREGLGAHWEMWMLGLGGMTPLEALRSATLNPAQTLGLDKDIGSLEPGKLADVVVLDGDVLKDIRQSDRIAQVMVGGRLYELPTMNEIGHRPKPRKPFFFEGLSGEQGQVPVHEDALDDSMGVGHVCKH
ncbi:amidohydrolase family protein [Inhella sp.]|uniref:amidohydrolase family protein n=1 Tax=Inhella sp. TaxID=1921806 RepID=UPI0035AEFB14